MLRWVRGGLPPFGPSEWPLGESVFYPVGKGASIPRARVSVNDKDLAMNS